MDERPLIQVSGLRVGFASRSGRIAEVLRGVDLEVRRGETVGIVGESGSGKSTLLLAAMGYLKRGLRAIEGSARFDGTDLLSLPRRQIERIRGRRSSELEGLLGFRGRDEMIHRDDLVLV